MRRPNLKWMLKTFIIILVSVILSVVITTLVCSSFYRREGMSLLPPINSKIDWNDYAAIGRDALRVGIGEQGKGGTIDNDSLKVLEKNMSLENGFNALLSDYISVNRSLPDMRHVGCRTKLYLAKLPTVSVVIPCFNEHLSVLKRSIHSLVNRSPPELLKEIIVVDDFSDRKDLTAPLEEYVAEHFPKMQIIRLKERTGLIGARLTGARKATGDVLIFLDSHIEATHNWLPPLLEPIALNKRTVICPFIDVIEHKDFRYREQDAGARGGFDWKLLYKRMPLLPESLVDRTKPHKSPVMAGGLFAISADFFWELGGYDEGLDIWGGEQYELSFKIWMCGGELWDVPCSRVAHVFRGPRKVLPRARKVDYVHRNYKRVAEVWMDEYKQYLYNHDPATYDKLDTGDISKQKALREKLNCKSFKWYMETVAFELTRYYPVVEPPDFAYGAIQSVGDPGLCIDMLNRPRESKIGLYPCSKNLKKPSINQNFALTYHRDIRDFQSKSNCFDVGSMSPNAPLWQWGCHEKGGNQYWYYDRFNQWLVHSEVGKRCLEAMPKERIVVANTCNKTNKNMRWKFGVVNSTALDYFDDDSYYSRKATSAA